MAVWFACVLVLGLSTHTAYGSTRSSSKVTIKHAGQALDALQRLLNFFDIDAANLNLDGLYGLRIAQGQLNALEQSLASSAPEQAHITDNNGILRSLTNQIERIANTSLAGIAHDQSEYLQRFALLASRPFTTVYEPRSIDKSLIKAGDRDAQFDEDESDKCFAELLGSSNRPNSTQCLISRPCWDMMTSPMSKDYRLTHQLLWFLIAKNIGCLDPQAVSRVVSGHFLLFQDQFCANMYEDARVNLKQNLNQDLFLEQLLLCSIVGYEEFLRLDWFKTVLSWQHPEYACFSDASETIRFGQRRLLFEQEMAHGCLSHKSGLAAGLLATYARVFFSLTRTNANE